MNCEFLPPKNESDRKMKSVLATLFLALFALAAQAADWQILSGRVVSVLDGDTVVVLKPDRVEHVRLSGIDAPEKKQPYGQRSKQFLASIVFGKDVTVEYRKFDRYGRIVGKVMLDGRDVNLSSLEAGMSWFYRQYANELKPEDRVLYEAAEQNAKRAASLNARKKVQGQGQGQEQGQNLWSDPDPVPPWDFRHNRSAK